LVLRGREGGVEGYIAKRSRMEMRRPKEEDGSEGRS
jgi:hypothetical protein